MTTMTRADFDGVVASVKQFESGWLRDLQSILTTELKSREKSDLQAAKLEILRICEDVGVPFEVLMKPHALTGRKHPPGRVNGPVPAKYQNPADPSVTWSGRGIEPYWIKKSGMPREHFLISNQAA